MNKMILGSTLLALTLSINSFANEHLAKPTPKVQKLIDKYHLEQVDFEYVKKAINKGTRKSAKAILVDARPEIKYQKGTIPSSINIPDTKFEQFFKEIKDVDKNKEIIVFCGGYKCGKSAKVAMMLQKRGFVNVKLYQAGEPEWKKKSYSEVDSIVVKSVQKKNSALIIDTRPYKKYLQETIIGAISIPDTSFDKLKGRFPINKDEKIITFCGGYFCAKSHKIANNLINLGYTNVNVYAGGLPKWKKEGNPTTKSFKVIKEKKEQLKLSNYGILKGVDEGTVDGEWFKKIIEEGKLTKNIQIVDVTPSEDYKNGHLPNAINIHAEKLLAKDLYKKLPKDKAIVFNCTSGARALEAWSKLNDKKYDISNIYYFDANINCDKNNKCSIEANEPLE